MKKIVITIIIILIVIFGGYFLVKTMTDNPAPVNQDTTSGTEQPVSQTPETPQQLPVDKTKTVIGKSVGGTDIVAYHYGEGSKELLLVGGLHGGYEWNTVLEGYEIMDYLTNNPDVIPDNVKVTVIPVANPDGLAKVTGTTGRFEKTDVATSQETLVAGRFNGNNVDLNRNFDCDWQASGVWQNKKVSGGTAAFSEPESLAIKNYVETNAPAAAIVWYSAAGGVYASNCHNGVSADTRSLMNTFAKASGYPAHENYNYYEITGDMVNWLAKKEIPAISVLLTTHDTTEWTKNKKGLDAVLTSLAQ